MILITGGATRIGAAIARRLAAKNINIIVHYHSSDADAKKLKNELESVGAKIILWQQDLRAADLVQQFQKLITAHGPIDTLINNAAVFYPEQDRPGEMTPKLSNEIMAINFTAPMTLMRESAAQFALSPGGRGWHEVPGEGVNKIPPPLNPLPPGEGKHLNIINILDQRVLNVSHAFPTYTASKLALFEATKKMAVQFAPNIRVNAIAPGHVLPVAGEDENKFRARQAKTPLGTGPAPAEIAEMIALILSSPSMTGACIPMDGGEHLINKIKI